VALDLRRQIGSATVLAEQLPAAAVDHPLE
jgi:hypothetical protein